MLSWIIDVHKTRTTFQKQKFLSLRMFCSHVAFASLSHAQNPLSWIIDVQQFSNSALQLKLHRFIQLLHVGVRTNVLPRPHKIRYTQAQVFAFSTQSISVFATVSCSSSVSSANIGRLKTSFVSFSV